MLGLPKATEIHKPLHKTAIYAKFHMNNAEKEKIDADISRVIIVNEVSAKSLNIPVGEKVSCFFVMHVALKKKDFDKKNIITLSKLIPQNILLVLEHNEESKLAVYHTKLMQTDWKPTDDCRIELKGLNLDRVWDNIVAEVGGFEIEQGNTLDEQIAINEKRQKLEKEIARLEKKARVEKQPKKKFELVQEIKNLKTRLQYNFIERK